MAGDPIPKTFKVKSAPKRLPPMSKKRAGLARERAEFVARILRQRPLCQLPLSIDAATREWMGGEGIDPPVWPFVELSAVKWGCNGRSCDVHEIVGRGRSGGIFVPSQGLTDDGVLALCRACHDWVTTHPALARLIGAERHYQPKET